MSSSLSVVATLRFQTEPRLFRNLISTSEGGIPEEREIDEIIGELLPGASAPGNRYWHGIDK
jgi:hypothetical protein